MKPRYLSFREYCLERYKRPIRKICIDAGFTCPNRDGTKAFGGCTYCNAEGSGPGVLSQDMSLEALNQIKQKQKKDPQLGFFLYFQAYTNTYGTLDRLKEVYDTVYCSKEIKALAIGTRPDCIDEDKLKLIHSYTEYCDVWLEYGLETSHQKTLDYINRQHSFEEMVEAYQITRKYRPIKVCLHLILGLPYETKQEMWETVKHVLIMKPDAIKIHNLYIEKGTILAHQYKRDGFSLLEKEEYIDLVVDIIEQCPKDMVIQRVNGEPLRDRLIAPSWAKNKADIIHDVIKRMEQRNTFQGKYFKS